MMTSDTKYSRSWQANEPDSYIMVSNVGAGWRSKVKSINVCPHVGKILVTRKTNVRHPFLFRGHELVNAE
jgi:hypothetical protein